MVQINHEGLSKQEIRDALQKRRHPFEVAVFGLKNEFNFGGVIRIAHCFMVSKIHAVNIDKKGYYRKGAMTALAYEKDNLHFWEPSKFFEYIRNRNLIAFEKRPHIITKDIRNFAYPPNPVLLFGSENYGIPEGLLHKANDVISIPMYGLVNDLNVATAVSVALYDWVSKYYD